MDEINWDSLMSQTAEQIWKDQSTEVRKNILFEVGLPDISNLKWDKLSIEQKETIEKYLNS
jgi:hypothetical protein